MESSDSWVDLHIRAEAERVRHLRLDEIPGVREMLADASLTLTIGG